MELDRFCWYEETKRRKLNEIDSSSSYAGLCRCTRTKCSLHAAVVIRHLMAPCTSPDAYMLCMYLFWYLALEQLDSVCVKGNVCRVLLYSSSFKIWSEILVIRMLCLCSSLFFSSMVPSSCCTFCSTRNDANPGLHTLFICLVVSKEAENSN